MSFILRKKPSSGAPRVSQEAVPSLPPDLVAAGGRRLALLGLISASVTVLMSAVDWHTFGRIPLPAHAQTLWLTANIAAVLISVAVSWIAFRQMLGPETLLDLGLVFEVALALCIAVSFHAVPLRPDVVPHGWTGVAVWIIAYPLIVRPFISSACVPTHTMPGPVRAFAEHQPVTSLVNAIRDLFTQQPVGTDIWIALAWCVGILIVAYISAMVIYRRKIT